MKDKAIAIIVVLIVCGMIGRGCGTGLRSADLQSSCAAWNAASADAQTQAAYDNGHTDSGQPDLVWISERTIYCQEHPNN